MKAAALLLALAAGMAAGVADAQQRVDVPSLDQPAGAPVVLPGHWFAAAAPGPAPAMVLLHGCGGAYGATSASSTAPARLAQRMHDYAAFLNGLGIHALVLDSLTPRGERELCTQRVGARKVTQTQRRRDALGALAWLRRQPGVDGQRLGLLGWSNGGSTVLAATNRGHPEVAAQPPAALAVAFYPGCEAELQARWQSPAPLLMLLGEADDWTPVAPCQALAGAARQAGSAVQVESYPGAHHGFDGQAPVRHRSDVPGGARPGSGVHVGGQAQAREASRAALRAFLQTQWKLAR